MRVRSALTLALLCTGGAGACQNIPLGLAQMTVNEAVRQGLPPALLLALVCAESTFNPLAQSPVGAMGLGQLMPGTAAGLGVDAWDPQQNLNGSARYLRAQLVRFGGSMPLALAAYNAGAGTVLRAGGVPGIPETVNYVAKVMALAPLFESVWRGWMGLRNPPPVRLPVQVSQVQAAQVQAAQVQVSQAQVSQVQVSQVQVSQVQAERDRAPAPVLTARPAAVAALTSRPAVAPVMPVARQALAPVASATERPVTAPVRARTGMLLGHAPDMASGLLAAPAGVAAGMLLARLDTPAGQPVTGQPVTGQPVTGQPVTGQPVKP